jgi:hypothetical protein
MPIWPVGMEEGICKKDGSIDKLKNMQYNAQIRRKTQIWEM